MPFPTGSTYSGSATYPSSGRMNVNVFLFDGDSMSLGTAAGGTPNSYPVILSSGYRYSGRADYYNIAIGGRDVGEMYSGFTATQPYRTSKNNGFLFIWGGTILTDTTSGFLRQYWESGRADGWKIIAFTVTPTSGWSQSYLQLWTGTNNYIIQNSGLYDYLVRTDLIITGVSDPNIYSDATHLTKSGYALVANYITTGINLRI